MTRDTSIVLCAPTQVYLLDFLLWCNGQFFPSQYFPRGKNGPILSRGEKTDRLIFFFGEIFD